MTTKIISWNVNSIRVRIEILLDYCKKHNVSIALLQELKCMEEQFPYEAIEDAGYNVVISGQKTYNGVAILSKTPIEDVEILTNLGSIENQARYIAATTYTQDGKAVRVASVYVPNGESPDSEKFQYKLRFLSELQDICQNYIDNNEEFVLGGDFNVAAHKIDSFSNEGGLCTTNVEREAFARICNLGMIDTYRILHPRESSYSWWDYRAGAFQKNIGLRIDYILITPKISKILSHAEIDIEPRKIPKTSDHTIIYCDLK